MDNTTRTERDKMNNTMTRTLTEIFYTSFDGNDYVIRMGDDQAVKECTENLRGFGITNITARVAECSPFDIVGTPVRLVAKR